MGKFVLSSLGFELVYSVLVVFWVVRKGIEGDGGERWWCLGFCRDWGVFCSYCSLMYLVFVLV